MTDETDSETISAETTADLPQDDMVKDYFEQKDWRVIDLSTQMQKAYLVRRSHKPSTPATAVAMTAMIAANA